MSLKFLRQYSQQALGHIKTQGSNVSVYVAQPVQQLELFTSLKQGDRDKAFEKVLSSIMFKQLSARNRNLVFRPTANEKLVSTDEKPVAEIELGDTVENVELAPRTYLGPPSRQDLRVLALTSKTSEDVIKATNYLQECLKSPKELGKNFDPVLTEMLLRRAATAGNFQDIFGHLTRCKNEFGKYMLQNFYSEALRIYALRVPYLSHRSKSMLNKLYSRSDIGLGRELSYAYGLNAYAQKFGDEHRGHLPDTFKNIKQLMEPFMERPRRVLMKSATLTDLVLGYEAAMACELPEARELVDPLKMFLEKTSHHRELTPSIVLNIGDNESDGESE